jgi:hypothetical protein
MLNYRAIGRLPEFITFARNGREAKAVRMDLGSLRIQDRCLWIADPGLIDSVPPLPVRLFASKGSIHTYQWSHSEGPINVCAVVHFRRQSWATTRLLQIHTNVRPDLYEGVIVDSGDIIIRSADEIQVQSGLGDGYYPVYANYNFACIAQSVIVDFQIWHIRTIIPMDGRELDEYGIPREKPKTC